MARKDAYDVKKVLDDIYVLGQGGVGCYLLVGKEKALLFDTGAGLLNPIPQIRKLTSLPLIIVNSHGHYDHSGGNSFFNQTIYIHKDDLELYRQHNSAQYRKIAVDGLKAMQKILFFMNIIPKHFDEDQYIHTPLFDRFALIQEGDLFDIGGMNAHVVEIPGHTKGGIGLFVPEKKLLLAGDGINGGVWMYLPESCRLTVYIKSLEKARQLDFDYLLTGHSAELLPKSVLKDYLAVAKNLDFEHGKIQKENAFAPGVEARACHEAGYRKQKRSKRNRAKIIISKEKLSREDYHEVG